MFKKLYILIFLAYSCIAQTQTKIGLNLVEGSDTTLTYYYKDLARYNLKYIESSIAQHAFRFSRSGVVITIYKTNDDLYGEVTQYVNNKEFEYSTEFFKMTKILDTLQVQQIFNLIDSTAINKIPSDKYIENWADGFDGITYVFEDKTDKTYSLKSYWTPTSQRGLDEAITIENFVQRLYDICNFSVLHKSFDKLIPFDAYSNGQGWIAQKILTRQEARKKRRLQKRAKS